MANMNIGTPRFYTDQVNNYLNKGTASTEFTLDTDVGLAALTGSADELFDMNPLNQVTFDTGSNTSAHVLVNLDMQATRPKSFIAILITISSTIAILSHYSSSSSSELDLSQESSSTTCN